VLVSAGGGIVGAELFRAAVDAYPRLGGLPMRIVAGPFLPEAHWQDLCARAAVHPGIMLIRHVSDLAAEMRAARCSVSQCGYNTALDIVAAGVPALVVPYRTDTENEQQHRAQRLAALGAVLSLDARPLDGATLADAIGHLLHFHPQVAALATDGAQRSAQWLAGLVADRAAAAQAT
jgi:predicted glycosyltransferase